MVTHGDLLVQCACHLSQESRLSRGHRISLHPSSVYLQILHAAWAFEAHLDDHECMESMHVECKDRESCVASS